MKYRVEFRQRSWVVVAPNGRTWDGLPSQPAAFALASSLAAVDTMITNLPIQVAS